MIRRLGRPARAKGNLRWLPGLTVAFVVATLAAPLLFTILINWADKRSFLVEARTGQITLTFGEGPNQWRLPDAILCLPVAVPRLGAKDACGAAFGPDGQAREWLIDWQEGQTVTLRIEPDGSFVVASVKGVADIPAGARLIVPADIWNSVGTLLFQAEATLGSDMAPGVRHYLWSGRWEAREAGAARFLFRSQTEVVKSGTLPAGARVDILKGEIPALSYGHISRRGVDGPMDVVLLSEFDDTYLSVRYYGVAQAVHIRPDWVDVAISSPLLLAVAAIFPFLASIGLYLSDMLKRTEATGIHISPGRENRRRHSRKAIRRGRRR